MDAVAAVPACVMVTSAPVADAVGASDIAIARVWPPKVAAPTALVKVEELPEPTDRLWPLPVMTFQGDSGVQPAIDQPVVS